MPELTDTSAHGAFRAYLDAEHAATVAMGRYIREGGIDLAQALDRANLAVARAEAAVWRALDEMRHDAYGD